MFLAGVWLQSFGSSGFPRPRFPFLTSSCLAGHVPWSSNTESILNYSAPKVDVGRKDKEDEEAMSLSVRRWGNQAHIQDVYKIKKRK